MQKKPAPCFGRGLFCVLGFLDRKPLGQHCGGGKQQEYGQPTAQNLGAA